MLIKDEYKLHVGDIIKFNGPSFANVERKQEYTVVIKEIYSHWVLGYVLDYEFNDDLNLKMCMNNIDLVMQGIYNTEAVKENAFGTSKELSNEQIEKIKTFNETHNTKAKYICR